MRKVSLALLVLCATAFAADKITPLNVKLGLWQSTVTSANSGQMPIPAEALAKLTPAQRARIEDRMKNMQQQPPRTHVEKSCLTKEKLEREQDPFTENKNCSRTVVTSTSSKMELKLECSESGVTAHGTMLVEALDSENAKGSLRMVASGGGGDRTMNLNSDFTSKWLGASCGDTK
jgi:hypothetical protein